MKHVLATAETREGFQVRTGGGDLGKKNMTIGAAEAYCAGLSTCDGFTYKGTENATGVMQIYFKTSVNVNSDLDWTTYSKRVGWATSPDHFLSEG